MLRSALHCILVLADEVNIALHQVFKALSIRDKATQGCHAWGDTEYFKVAFVIEVHYNLNESVVKCPTGTHDPRRHDNAPRTFSANQPETR